LDRNTSVSILKEKVARFRDERDWLKFHNPKDLSIALSIESAELEELFLWKDNMSANRIKRDQKQLQRVKEEIADVFIYLLSLSNVLGLDVSEAVDEKLEHNAKKYPVSKSKESNKKYDEL